MKKESRNLHTFTFIVDYEEGTYDFTVAGWFAERRSQQVGTNL
jgi:hypothetical protein